MDISDSFLHVKQSSFRGCWFIWTCSEVGALSTERESWGFSPNLRILNWPGPQKTALLRPAEPRSTRLKVLIRETIIFLQLYPLLTTLWNIILPGKWRELINKNVFILKTECLVCKTECILFNIRASELVWQTFPFSSKSNLFYSMLLLFSFREISLFVIKSTFFS